MIGAVRDWLLSIAAVTLFLTVVQLLTPEGTLRKIASFSGGLLLLTALLRPMAHLDLSWMGLQLSDYAAAIEYQTEELASSEKEALAGLIEERTAAYISDKADALGVPVEVRVGTEAGEEGIPIPVFAELEGPWSPELEAWIAAELGIPTERQVWHEGKD